jgi:hypothetical protein
MGDGGHAPTACNSGEHSIPAIDAQSPTPTSATPRREQGEHKGGCLRRWRRRRRGPRVHDARRIRDGRRSPARNSSRPDRNPVGWGHGHHPRASANVLGSLSTANCRWIAATTVETPFSLCSLSLGLDVRALCYGHGISTRWAGRAQPSVFIGSGKRVRGGWDRPVNNPGDTEFAAFRSKIAEGKLSTS